MEADSDSESENQSHQGHKLEIAALNKRFEMDKAKAETKNAAQLAEFIQSDMWEVITNGTTVSSLTILGVLMTILWRKIMTVKSKFRAPQARFGGSCKLQGLIVKNMFK